MKTSKKPLHVSEQSMLLATFLFARKNVDEVLSFLPNEQIERIGIAKLRFLRLEHSERVAKIILELRRLLLLSQRETGWIHQSWINHALAHEPGYLQALIANTLSTKTTPGNSMIGLIPSSVIFHSFLNQFECTQKKVAIFDPILMRLQSMDDHSHEPTLRNIGRHTLSLLAQVCDAQRLQKYIGIDLVDVPHNPVAIHALKPMLLKHIIAHKRQPNVDIEIGTLLLAAYLSTHSAGWQKTIALMMERKLGYALLQKTREFNNVSAEMHLALKEILLASIDTK